VSTHDLPLAEFLSAVEREKYHSDTVLLSQHNLAFPVFSTIRQ